MKIEIGESLMLSYLKHVKKCLISQLNWKISNIWETETKGNEQLEYFYNKIIAHSEFTDIFKAGLNQTLKQAEVDAIGIDSNNKIFAVDVAFHENGLQYGDKIETKNRIIKKLLRSYLTLLSLFPDSNYEIIFASPKVNATTEKVIIDYFSLLSNDFRTEKVLFKYISNELFKNEILIPTIKAAASEADTSELFIRSIKLLDIFNLLHLEESELGPVGGDPGSAGETEMPSISIKAIVYQLYKKNNETIQDFVKETLRLMFDNKLIPDSEINNMLDKDYCNKIFGIAFPIIQNDKNKLTDNAGYSRYWSDKIFGQYYACSQWYDKQKYRDKLANWIKKISNLNKMP
jgi:hypothetical protein